MCKLIVSWHRHWVEAETVTVMAEESACTNCCDKPKQTWHKQQQDGNYKHYLHSLSFAYGSLCLCLSLSLPLPLSHTHTYACSLTLKPAHTCMHVHMYAHIHACTHTHSCTHTHTLSLSHTHTHTHTHSLSLSHTHTHKYTSFPLSFSRHNSFVRDQRADRLPDISALPDTLIHPAALKPCQPCFFRSMKLPTHRLTNTSCLPGACLPDT